MKTYAEQLRDPRWQKKRLEIMQRDGFKCIQCAPVPEEFSDHASLNVHHCFYEFGRAPWDYPDHSLRTLCEGCHEAERADKERAEREFIQFFRRLGATNGELLTFGIML